MVWLTESAARSFLLSTPLATVSVGSSICSFSSSVRPLPLQGSPGVRQGQVTVPSAAALLLRLLSCDKDLWFFF